MLPDEKKREYHAGKEEKLIDFAWILYIGMTKFSYSEKEVGHMYYGKWAELFEVYKKDYNFAAKKMIYQEERKKVSLLTI